MTDSRQDRLSANERLKRANELGDKGLRETHRLTRLRWGLTEDEYQTQVYLATEGRA